MTEGFTQFFPAKVGDTVYEIIKGDIISEARVEFYRIAGEQAHKNRVMLSYVGSDGKKYEKMRKLTAFGRTIFPNRQQAELALKTKEERL